MNENRGSFFILLLVLLFMNECILRIIVTGPERVYDSKILER